MRTNLVIVENGKFIFDTNFAGDPKKDRFGSDERKANLVIPDIDLAMDNQNRISYSKCCKQKTNKQYLPEYLVWILEHRDEQNKKRVDYHAMQNKK